MLHRTKTAAMPAILAAALLLPPLAIAAPEGAAPEAPQAQVQPDDHSYLPPWMEPQANAGPAGIEAQYLNALDDPALKQKTQAQKPQRRHSEGLLGLLFGR